MAIGNGKPHWGKAFVEEEGIDFPVFTDPSRESYKAFGMKRGFRAVTGAKTMKHGARAAAGGFRQTKTKGDATQIGGVLVIDGDGTVVWEHIEQEAGDLCDFGELIAALQAHSS